MEFNLIDRDGGVVVNYENKEELLRFVKKYTKKDFRVGYDHPVKDNKLLRNIGHCWGDTKPLFDKELSSTLTPKEYMLADIHGRIVNISDLAEEAWNYRFPNKSNWKQNLYDIERWARYDEWRKIYKKRCKHADYHGYYRQKNVQQERRFACDVMHKPFVRPKRRPHRLEPWGELETCVHQEITWKQLKIKKQWQEKLIKGGK